MVANAWVDLMWMRRKLGSSKRWRVGPSTLQVVLCWEDSSPSLSPPSSNDRSAWNGELWERDAAFCAAFSHAWSVQGAAFPSCFAWPCVPKLSLPVSLGASRKQSGNLGGFSEGTVGHHMFRVMENKRQQNILGLATVRSLPPLPTEGRLSNSGESSCSCKRGPPGRSCGLQEGSALVAQHSGNWRNKHPEFTSLHLSYFRPVPPIIWVQPEPEGEEARWGRSAFRTQNRGRVLSGKSLTTLSPIMYTNPVYKSRIQMWVVLYRENDNYGQVIQIPDFRSLCGFEVRTPMTAGLIIVVVVIIVLKTYWELTLCQVLF